MKIREIRTTPLALRFKEPYIWAGRRDLGSRVLLVEVETDQGILGIGESATGQATGAALSLFREVSPLLVGESPYDVERLVALARVEAGLNEMPRFANVAFAGFEMALWDILGKAAGQPACNLLGGACRPEVDYFAFLQGETAEELVADAEAAVSAGYSIIYLKVGRGETVDLANTAAVRGAIGRRRLRLDANEAWGPSEAIYMIGRLAGFQPEWIEQPTPGGSLAALKQVKDSVGIPITADQSVFTAGDVYEVCRQRAADVIVLSPHETGGLLAFKKAAAIAEAAGIGICLHGRWVTGITDCAQHQLGLTLPNLTDGNQIMHQLLVEDILLTPDITPRSGKLGRLDGPGLGFELDRDAVGRAAELYRQRAAK